MGISMEEDIIKNPPRALFLCHCVWSTLSIFREKYKHIQGLLMVPVSVLMANFSQHCLALSGWLRNKKIAS